MSANRLSQLIELPPHRRHRGLIKPLLPAGNAALADNDVKAIAAGIVENRIGGPFWRRLDNAVTKWLAGFKGEVAVVDGSVPAATIRLLACCRRLHRDLPILVVGARAGRAETDGEIMFDLLSDPWPVIERTAVLYSAEPATPFARLAALANRPIFRLDTDGEPLAIDQGTIIGDAINDLSTAWSYSSPYDGSAWTPLQMLDYLGLWRRRLDDTAGIGAVVGVGRWKRGRTREILIGSPDLIFAPNAEKAVRDARGSAIAAWPSRTDTAALGRNFPSENIWRLEDGFIRSAGLGAALVKPNSLVLDRRGIYYDPRTPSDLEHILQSVEFSDGLRERARLLIAQIRRNGATKYNLPGEMIDLPSNRHIILVAGQVSDDQSVLTAGAGTTVVDILAAVRAENPDSYLVYKAHPDVAARLRKGEWRGEAITAHADLVLAGGDIDALLARVDQVHVLSSLLGLEALLRGCNVVTHGQPFFAGWGLTEDRAPVARRTRRLSLEELVAATLIIYPLYVDPKSGLPCSIEHLLDRLADAKPPSRGRMLLARIIEPLRKCRIRAHRIPI